MLLESYVLPGVNPLAVCIVELTFVAHPFYCPRQYSLDSCLTALW
eukprot:COSAG01_NODE_8170_length_2892_cov_21.246330_3_plen_45_part_00